jgi:hypothetical protein
MWVSNRTNVIEEQNKYDWVTEQMWLSNSNHSCSVTQSHLFCCSITIVLLLTHICSVTQSHLFCYSLTFVLFLNHICSVTQSHLFCYSIIFVLLLNHICSVTQSHLFCYSIVLTLWFSLFLCGWYHINLFLDCLCIAVLVLY